MTDSPRSRTGRSARATLLGVVALVVLASCQSAEAHTQWAVPTPHASGMATSAPRASGSAAPAGSASPGGKQTPIRYPRSGPGTFRYAGTGPVLGSAGTLRRFRVALESNLTMIDVDDLAARIDATLGDRRSWIGGGTVRFQRVAPGSPYQFTIYLVTSKTTDAMCTSGGIATTGGYTSCRYSGHVVLNLDRWVASVPDYTRAKVPIEVYRTYMINHEVGHELDYDHELCPGRGRPAPVMQQQTLGLHGCTANPWPYLNGSRYAGPPGRY